MLHYSPMSVAALTSMDNSIRRPSLPGEWAEATALLHDHLEWVRVAAGIDLLDVEPGLTEQVTSLASHFDGRDGEVFVAHVRDVAVGTVSVRFHADGTAELKRMFVRPVARGLGLADALVDAVVEAATTRGCELLWLETKRGAMDRAIAVYRRCGFEVVGPERLQLSDPDVIVMERRL
jgi:GNAT superfamily N-acetyltransferase